MNLTALFSLATVLALSGCARSANPNTPAQPSNDAPVQPSAEKSAQHGHQHGGATAHGDRHAPAQMGASCPMRLPGTTVSAEDVEGGIALNFATSAGDVTELQRRVQHMSEMHAQHHAGQGHGPGKEHAMKHQHSAAAEPDAAACSMPCCQGHGGHGAKMHGDKPMGMMGPPAQTRSESTASGARLVFTPINAADLEGLRASVRQRAEKMASGKCALMQGAKGDAPAAAASETPATEAPAETH